MRKYSLFKFVGVREIPRLIPVCRGNTPLPRLLAWLLLALAAAGAWASEIDDLQIQLIKIEVDNKSGELTVDRVNKALKALVVLKGNVDTQTEKQQVLVNEASVQLESLGEENAAEPREVREKRASLRKELQQNETLLAKYKVLSIAVTERYREYQDKSQSMFKERLLSRGPTLIEVIPKAIETDALMVKALSKFILQRHGLDQLALNDYIAMAVWILLAGIVSHWAGRKLKQWSSTRRWGDAAFDIFAQSTVLTLTRYLPWLILSMVLAAFMLQFQPTFASASFVQIIILLFPLYLFAQFAVEIVLLPRPPARRVMRLDDRLARFLFRWCYVFINVVFIGAIIFWMIFSAEQPELTVLITRDVFVIFGVPLVITVLLFAWMGVLQLTGGMPSTGG